jgi:outer membrane protein assembly factor BamB
LPGFSNLQEQRGDDEVVAAYKTATGEPVWMHRAAARFYEPMGGAGPRGTPTVSSGRVYPFGATGIVTALDASDGAVVWSRDGATDTHSCLADAVQQVVRCCWQGHLNALVHSVAAPWFPRERA